ncbi:MAG: coenzyme F420-0:L-glutamate ligase [Armatimonadota bacterium]|nr:coenzyme F420-0:L-glutamate ligase [Armatimonadota bacterium]MDR7438295.1 coenzyme F420-0:L-glutamate ligase [Armatimonadota bacterium]MDR7443383.1 coenzyme F420-0:L-glutamate ligase [Armatimonadota bacterium]MDR7563412.1 coenzyme F420-0:L-glutamate ligase [Armatimonadota bacterium]MDR7568931.1 coenzyme F420-0:L-glutamate ligase [Armatimonadota bacterium]
MEIWYRAPERFPMVRPGDDLPGVVVGCLEAENLLPRDGDVIVIAHKVVSIAEGRVVSLEAVNPSPQAQALAREVGKDPRLVEIILQESAEVLRSRPGLLITRHRLGFVCANAGVDHSNAGPGKVVLLPEDPDRSAFQIRERIEQAFGARCGVIVSDTHGRAHREGAVGVCIGLAGLSPFLDHRGRQDLFGYVLRTSVEALADELASGATILMGQSAERRPLVLIRGVRAEQEGGSARALIRPRERDLFG